MIMAVNCWVSGICLIDRRIVQDRPFDRARLQKSGSSSQQQQQQWHDLASFIVLPPGLAWPGLANRKSVLAGGFSGSTKEHAQHVVPPTECPECKIRTKPKRKPLKFYDFMIPATYYYILNFKYGVISFN